MTISPLSAQLALPTGKLSVPTASVPVDTYSSSNSSVGKVTLNEAAWVVGAAGLGALISGAGGGSVAAFGPAVGIPAAIVGEGVAGVVVGRLLTLGAHDGSAVGGMMMVGGMAGGIGGGVGSIVGALTAAVTGNPAMALVGGAVAGGLVAGGFATYLALGN